MPDKVKMTLEMSAELNQVLEQLAESLGTTKSDVVRKALVLMEVASAAKSKGQTLGVVTKDEGKLVTQIVGL